MIRTKKTTLKQWLKNPVKVNENCIKEDGKIITHENFINQFTNDIIDILHKQKYNIIYLKEFKNELSNIIYSLSDI